MTPVRKIEPMPLPKNRQTREYEPQLPVFQPAEPEIPRPRSIWDDLRELWAVRACFICEKYGTCWHREVDADVAWLLAKGVGR
jgi:hypothetical protein